MAITYDRINFDKAGFEEELGEIYSWAFAAATAHIMADDHFFGGESRTIVYDNGSADFTGWANNMKAWIEEYGSGEKRRYDNPHWNEYLGKEFYNRLRNGNTIVTWDSDDERRKLWADVYGREVEIDPPGEGKSGGKRTPFQGETAKPFIDDLLIEAYFVFCNRVKDQLQTVNINKFLTLSTETI